MGSLLLYLAALMKILMSPMKTSTRASMNGLRGLRGTKCPKLQTRKGNDSNLAVLPIQTFALTTLTGHWCIYGPCSHSCLHPTPCQCHSLQYHAHQHQRCHVLCHSHYACSRISRVEEGLHLLDAVSLHSRYLAVLSTSHYNTDSGFETLPFFIFVCFCGVYQAR